jgi:hypothetical protein
MVLAFTFVSTLNAGLYRWEEESGVLQIKTQIVSDLLQF